MQHQIEAKGATVEEAIANALGELGASRDDVKVEVLDPGGAKILGTFRGRSAQVRVQRLVGQHQDLAHLTRELLAKMGIPAEVALHEDGEVHELRITTDGLDGLLIGRRGQTLAALQHLVSRMASKEFGQDGHVVLDIGDYRRRREAHLVEKSQALAEKVRITGREISLEPLHAPDRRVVHLAIADVEGVRSYTVGQGLHRTVVIAPESRR